MEIKKLKIKKSTIVLIIILLLYTILSFYKLGGNKNPQTWTNLKNGEQLSYKIESDAIIDKMQIYAGNDSTYVSVFLAQEYQNYDTYVYDVSFDNDYPFKWIECDINAKNEKYNYIVLQSYFDTTVLGEMKVFDTNGNEVTLTPLNERSKILLDEQSTVPDEYSYMNSSYFDEVYFPRAAYEIMNKLPIFEYVHPPLGKLIMSIPMSFMGVTPFAYRLMGNISGILMILVIYCIAKELFKSEKCALFAAGIMALDGMHFVQTRIGTVDTFLVLFCLSAFLFFVKYIKLGKEENLKKRIIPLLIAGTFWGMAISVKWTAAFVGLGMGIIYFVDLIVNKKFSLKLILFSILSFVIIPIIIYLASYIPVINNPNEGITDIKSFFEYQQRIYNYHSKLSEDHPFSSKWYTWPILKKPVWYYVAYLNNGQKGVITSLGNPAIWWLSVGTAIFTLIYSLIKRNREGLMLIVMILTTWASYSVIGRVMFMYHYFITLPFMMLTIVFTIHKLISWKKQFSLLIPILTLVFLATFAYFYPIYSGKPADNDFIEKTKILDTWIY